jgi:hypothetical protein
MNRDAAQGDECLETRAFAVSWFKRYLVGCLIAVVFFAGLDAYRRPGEEAHLATILVASVGWPVFAALVVGGVVGDVVHDVKYGKAG